MTQEFQTIRQQMLNKLTESFAPQVIEVIDDSHRHIGHAGHNGEGQSHFRVNIVSPLFAGKSRIEKHRMVYDALKGFIPPVHALQIKASAPSNM
ncbi:MAG: BolA family transcriptional regulator [Micavibrio aeruginosavorus]|uniref:BolA family transcriptional regulator n=1 Tax=Micavibrio aeruginosavorus TaxID=349221 RepID=A0A2W5FGR4_9BACT|nr:MAG: BolA family transcriptional regulator [Micavibrio aeruginosavorus]